MDNLNIFLSMDIATSVAEHNVGTYLRENKIFRQHLLNPEQLKSLPNKPQITNGLILDLIHFFQTHTTSWITNIKPVLDNLGLNTSEFSEKQLTSRLRSCMERHKSLKKSIKRPNGQKNIEQFLSNCFMLTPTVSSNPEPRHFTDSDRALASMTSTISALRRDNEALQDDLETEQQVNDTLRDRCSDYSSALNMAQEKLVTLENQNTKLQTSKEQLDQQLKESQVTVQRIRGANFYKRLQRRERQLNRDRADLQARKARLNGVRVRVRKLRRKLKMEQTRSSNLRQQRDRLKTELDQIIQRHEAEIADLMANHHEDHPQVQTLKDQSKKEFSDEIKKTVISLISLQVSAQNCPLVIQTVARNLFNTDISREDLPSERTVRRFADQGHVLAKVQVAEAMCSGNYDLHTDGTSRDKKKWIGYQVKTDQESLSCGFTTVAAENSTTLVDTTLNLLHELSEVFDEEERHDHFRRILGNLSGIMTDRAAVMKKFKSDFNSAVQATLGTEESIEFLSCNAHFLLGLSSKTNSACKLIQEDRQELNLGRDMEPQFHNFKTAEAAVVRYIRMACEVFGPRGDEKNGCRDGWLAYCALNDKTSIISSFKSNRFNNLFEASAALHYHRADIVTFLEEYMPEKNGKLRSVLFDAACDQLAAYILALALVFYRITGPYWDLLGTGIHYLDFHVDVVSMKAELQEWSEDAKSMFDPGLPALFGRDRPNCAPFDAAMQVDEDMKSTTVNILQPLCGHLLSVVDLQLQEFLPGGQYHDVQDPHKRKKMAHSSMTNLLGEACFGDLDLSIYKRRNATSHHHATMNMLIRNNTIDKWFQSKSSPDQEQLLQLSAKKADSLRKRHRQEELDVAAERQRLLQQAKVEHERKLEALARRKEQITVGVIQQGGPCKTPAEVDALVTRYTFQKDKKAALQLQFNYHKIVLNKKSAWLKTSKLTIEELANNLKTYLGEAAGDLDQLPNLGLNVQQQEDNQDLAMEVDLATESDEEEECIFGDFVFSKVGENVAVYYDTEFHVGSVSEVLSPDHGKVNFLRKCTVANNTYVWPHKPEEEVISAIFVFSSGFDIVSRNGRVWSVPEHDALSRRYVLYRERYAWCVLALSTTERKCYTRASIH